MAPINGTVTTSGPLFNGTTARVVDQFLNAAVAEIGRAAEEEVRAIGHSSFKVETGNWSRNITMRRPSIHSADVRNGVIYGPWLETGQRRGQQTRFKGYHMWRRTTQKIQGEAARIATSVLQRYIHRM